MSLVQVVLGWSHCLFQSFRGLFTEAHRVLWCSLSSRAMAKCMEKLSLYFRDRTETGNDTILMITMLLTWSMYEIARILFTYSMSKLSSFLFYLESLSHQFSQLQWSTGNTCNLYSCSLVFNLVVKRQLYGSSKNKNKVKEIILVES